MFYLFYKSKCLRNLCVFRKFLFLTKTIHSWGVYLNFEKITRSKKTKLEIIFLFEKMFKFHLQYRDIFLYTMGYCVKIFIFYIYIKVAQKLFFDFNTNHRKICGR